MNAANDNSPDQIDLYWRPGCGFCMGLRRGLDRLGIERVEHNIWDDDKHAATVRKHANGNETVPTVVVGSTVMVNPSAAEVVAVLEARAPHLLPDGFEAPPPSKVGRLMSRVLGS